MYLLLCICEAFFEKMYFSDNYKVKEMTYFGCFIEVTIEEIRWKFINFFLIWYE